MSSLPVRNAFKTFIQTELATENLVDLSGSYEEVQDLLDKYSLTPDDPWLGLQCIGGDETPVDAFATNTKGKYRELGVAYLHIVGIVEDNAQDAILLRAETIRNKFRGQRIGNLIIEKVGPPNFGVGITLQFTGGYIGAVVVIDYKYDLNL